MTARSPESTDVQPVLFLDIDGVLSVLDLTKDKTNRIPETFWCRFNPDHGVWLRTLATAGVEVQYISDWQYNSELDPVNSCHELIGKPLELPVFPQFDYNRATGLAGQDGRSQAIAQAYPTRPVIWIDDEVDQRAHQWATQRNRTAPTLLIQTEGSIGLQAADMQRVDTWLSQFLPL